MVVAFALVVAVIIGLQSWTTSQYAITPGNATPVSKLVRIEGVATNHHLDKIMFTDVYLQSLTALQWIFTHFEAHVQFVGANELVEPGVPTSELNAQGYLEMRDAKQAAEVTAFRTLGWRVPATPLGTIVNAVAYPSPASIAGLAVGDEIVGVNGAPVRTSCQLVDYLHTAPPRTRVRLSVRRVNISASGAFSWRTPSTMVATTVATPRGVAPSGCAGISGVDRSWLGVGLEDDVAYRLPARVTINTANIGGPSAGLAMTLALINELSRGSLTGHHVVAATGTISLNGAVGDVGGVAEKTVAVQRAGARYFIVPRVEVATARQAAAPGLTILGVTSLAQALHDLHKLGGTAPEPLAVPG